MKKTGTGGPGDLLYPVRLVLLVDQQQTGVKRRVTGQVLEIVVVDQATAGIQGSPSVSMTRASKKLRPCLAAVDR